LVPSDLRGGVSDASRQLRALAMLSGSLTDPLTPRDAADVVGRQGPGRPRRGPPMLSGSLTAPLTPRDAADVVERQALAVLDATSAVVVTLGEFPPNDGADSSVLLDATPPVEARDGIRRAGETLT